MNKCKLNDATEKDSVQSDSEDLSGAARVRSEVNTTDAVKRGGLVRYILQDPAGFIFNPEAAQSHFEDSDYVEAYNFFSAQVPDRFVYSISSALFHKPHRNLDVHLYASGMSDFRQSRFWPFWRAGELDAMESRNERAVEDYLLGVWNESARESAGMFYQTGFLEVEECQQIGKFFFFKCILPVRRHTARRPDSLTFAFDSETRGFYTVNARVRCAEPEHRFKFIEFIEPSINPPNVQKFISTGSIKKRKVLLVLDRHIGENLSLFTTHLSYLSKHDRFDVTLDAAMCPLFQKAPLGLIQRFLPGTGVEMLGSLPANRADYDIVFDPYDWLECVFELKPQNDSGATSIVSALEYCRCRLQKKRRDILDIHMSSLKRMGIVSAAEPVPEFVRLNVSAAERLIIRQKARSELLQNSPRRNCAKIVSLFPFGMTDDRRYSVEALQTVIRALLSNPDVYVVMAGNNYDTPEMAIAAGIDLRHVGVVSRERIKFFTDEPLSGLIDLMLASDVVVSMDSGPLHLARSLRLHPIGLYTEKVNDPEKLMLFPWFVEDGTVEVLKPDIGEKHVFPHQLLSAIQKRIHL